MEQSDSSKSAINKIKGIFANISGSLTNSENSQLLQVVFGVIIFLVVFYVYKIISNVLYKKTTKQNDTPVILNGLVDASYGREIKQDPNNKNSKTLLRSQNENGIEYTYSVWMYIDNKTWDVNSSTWKHVLHKGPNIVDFKNNVQNIDPEDIVEIQCPGIWIDPKENTLRLYVNTYSEIDEYVELNNLPIKKWIHLVYSQSNFTAKIYINGRLKTVHELATLPRQNYYNLYLTQNDGFSGYLSTMQYFNYEVSYSKIIDITKKGPSLKEATNDNSISAEHANLSSNLPYLSNKWWVNDLTLN